MDGETFDRLSVQLQRLREQATRRGALRLLLGGSLAAAISLPVEQSEAKNKNRKNKYNKCRGYGAFCDSHHDCCGNNCINNHCYPGHGGGGNGSNCNGLNCPNGWGCQRNGSVYVCVPNNYDRCCGGYCYGSSYNCCNGNYGGVGCPIGWECCGFNQCCGDNQHCCGNGRCCPNGWYCNNNGTCDPYYYNGVSTSSAESIPSTPAISNDESEYYKIPE
jgi:hypothetical protein